MPKLNERLQLLEQLLRNDQAADDELSQLPPERLAAALREGIAAMERHCDEGRGDEPLSRERDARAPWRTASEALPALRVALADLEREHGLAH